MRPAHKLLYAFSAQESAEADIDTYTTYTKLHCLVAFHRHQYIEKERDSSTGEEVKPEAHAGIRKAGAAAMKTGIEAVESRAMVRGSSGEHHHDHREHDGHSHGAIDPSI